MSQSSPQDDLLNKEGNEESEFPGLLKKRTLSCSSSTSEPDRKRSKKSKKNKKRKRLSSNSSPDRERRRKSKKSKKKKKKSNNEKDKVKTSKTKEKTEIVEENPVNCDIPLDLMTPSSSKSTRPETKEEFEQRQSKIERRIDPITGRSRLIKGDGEVLEECVSRERHIAINKVATIQDGEFFQSKVNKNVI